MINRRATPPLGAFSRQKGVSMGKKDWAGLVVYAIALALVFTALTLLSENSPASAVQFFQR